jgi:hypothetical protein
MIGWKAQRTLLIVGEGYHEEAFLKHIKQLLVPRGCGLQVKVKNARGKGAQHVIEWTGRQAASHGYDVVAALLDTDTDWNSSVARLAKKKKIQVFASAPCFEAMLLRALGDVPVGNGKALKKQLAPYVNNDATRYENYAGSFNVARLQAARILEPTIDDLLKLFSA